MNRGQFSWAMFDWANQPFFTVVTTFIFGPYFANVLIGDPVKGQAAWGFAQSIAGGLVAILSPFLGAMADASGRRKPFIFAFQLLVVSGCIGLWWAHPGRPDVAPWIALAVIVATVGAEMSVVFNNAMLPHIVTRERMGRLSGYAWGLGYCGGLISLFIVLMVSLPAMFGLAANNQRPLFGLDASSHELERIAGPASAIWLIVFVLPMFLFTPDSNGAPRKPLLQVAWQGCRSLFDTLRKLSTHRNAFVYLLAFMLYNDGLAAIIAFGGIYASATFGWSTTTLGIFGIILMVFGIPGCILGGRLDDWLGSKRVVQLAICGVIVATAGILGVTADRVLFFVEAGPLSPTRGLFGSLQEQVFMAFALLLGFCMGPLQAASRTLIGRLAPVGMTGEFFGLFALSGRATAWLAPLGIAIVTAATHSTRLGVAIVLFFLVAGFVLLLSVREERASG